MRIRSALVIVCMSSAPCAGAVLRVPSEYPTINAALDATAPGDTVLVAPGAYTGAETRVVYLGGAGPVTVSSLAFLRNGVTLLSEGGSGVTTLDFGGQSIGGFERAVVGGLFDQQVCIDGFRIVGLPSTGGVGVYIQESALVRVVDCEFEGIRGGTSQSGGAIFAIESSLTVNDCVFTDCGVAAVASGGITMSGCDVLTSGKAVTADLSPFVSGSASIRNCTFVAVHGTQAPVSITGGHDDVVVDSCRFVDCSSVFGGGGLAASGVFPTPVTITRNVFIRCATTGSGSAGGGVSVGVALLTLADNTFVNCSVPTPGFGAAVFTNTPIAPLRFERNVLFGSSGSVAFSSGPAPTTATCNVYWNNVDGDSSTPLAPSDRIVDPLFCDPLMDNLTLDAASPCLPANSNGCGQIGAFGQACGPVSVRAWSWGQIKGAYR